MSRRAQKYKERHGLGGEGSRDLENEYEDEVHVHDLQPQLQETLATVPAAPKTALPPNDTLGLFHNTFRFLFDSPNLESFIQTVKGDLFNRDYIKAFGDDDRRMAYCTRWTPARSLAYASLFSELTPVATTIGSQDSKILAIGGGACGELVAFSSIYTQMHALKEGDDAYTTKININLIDIADWSLISNKITSEIQKKWVYQNPDSINVSFTHDDVLKTDPSKLGLSDLDLVTLMFTTNELFAEDKAASLRFFQSLNRECSDGTLLLITESAGSYSHITVGTKKFPIQFLIDTILLGKDQKSGDWEVISQSDSCWYRCGNNLEYPLKLENMRFFYRLYRKETST